MKLSQLLAAGITLSLLTLGTTAMAGSCSDSKSNAKQAKNKGHETATKNIVETAMAAGNFSTLLAAVQAAGLTATLKGTGPFTVFAPTDAAFAKLPAGTVESLLADKAKLASILTYHVVPGRVFSSDLTNDQTATTVQGQSVKFTIGSSARVNDANIVAADIAASNGVIHVIDTVILPPLPLSASAAQ